MAPMMCAQCNADGEPAAAEGAILTCGTCGATVVRLSPDDLDTRPATLRDVDTLSPDAVRRLRHAHAAIVRPRGR